MKAQLKWIGLVAIYLLMMPSALAYPCPGQMAGQEQLAKAHQWLAMLPRQSEVGDCHLEISVCDLSKQSENADGVMAEVFVRDGQGREVYLPLTVTREDSSATQKVQMDLFRNRLNYIKHDYLFEEEYGRTEGYQLDIRLDKVTGVIRRLDIGTYATRKKLRMSNGNQSRWYNCKAS